MGTLGYSAHSVLIVEDEPLVRLVAASIVEDEGFVVREAANAAEAIYFLEKYADISLVFTDVNMPGSMDGLALARHIRARWPRIEVIVTSGLAQVSAEELPTNSLFVKKPYRAEQITGAIHRMLGRPSAAA